MSGEQGSDRSVPVGRCLLGAGASKLGAMPTPTAVLGPSASRFLSAVVGVRSVDERFGRVALEAAELGTRVGAGGGGGVKGVVVEPLPNGVYRVELENGAKVLAHVADRAGTHFTRLLAGDKVGVELAESDRSRGRIREIWR